MNTKTRFLVVLIIAGFLSSCASLKPFTDDDFRQLGVDVKTSEQAAGN